MLTLRSTIECPGRLKWSDINLSLFWILMSNSSSFIFCTVVSFVSHGIQKDFAVRWWHISYSIREKPCEGASEFICDGKEEGAQKISGLVAKLQLTKDVPFNNILLVRKAPLDHLWCLIHKCYNRLLRKHGSGYSSDHINLCIFAKINSVFCLGSLERQGST